MYTDIKTPPAAENCIGQESNTPRLLQEYQYPFNVDYGVVLGCPRSGTTFLIEALRAMEHSECVSGQLYPLALPHLVSQNVSIEIYQTLSNSFEFSIQDYLTFNAMARLPCLQRWIRGTMSFAELLQGLKGKRKIERFIYKEPFLGFSPELIYNALPQGKIVHIYRDGRDCADSLIRKYQVLTDEKLMTLRTAEIPIGRKVDHRYVPWWVEVGLEADFLAASPFVRSVWLWKEVVKRCHDFFSRPEVRASGRVLLVRYEDLVRSPEEWGSRIVEHFGGSMNSRLKKQFSQAKESSVGVYQRLETKEIEKANAIAQSELKLYGYL